MGDDSSESGSEVSVTMFRCKYCPDTEFTAAERDLHRQQHREQRRRSGRETSPATTMFTRLNQESPRDASESGSPRRRGTPKKRPGPKSKTMGPPAKKKKERKIRSNKKYDRHVEKVSSDGG